MKNKLDNIISKRIRNSKLFDKLLKSNKNIKTVKRLSHLKEVYHLYHINVRRRDALKRYLIKNSIDAKVHYPIPIHLQPAAKYLNYKKGDFPKAELIAKTTISLPVHEYISTKKLDKIFTVVKGIV